MKDNISYELRNRIVEEHLHCINTVIWQNWSLIQAARLERDDVYQQLAIRLIRCVDTYDPSKGPLKMSAPFENVDFRRNGVSFLTGQHTGVIQP